MYRDRVALNSPLVGSTLRKKEETGMYARVHSSVSVLSV